MKKRSPFWRKAAVGADLVFLLLALGLGFAYLRQPQRGLALRETWNEFEQSYESLRRPFVMLLAPSDVSRFQGERLAIFGDNLEFLGCDVAITRDREGTHVWHLTLWRTLRPAAEDYHLVLEIVPADGTAPLRAEHALGQQFAGGETPTSGWQPGQVMVDATLLPEGVDPSEAYRQRIQVSASEEGSWLSVDTLVLEVDPQGWLMICE